MSNNVFSIVEPELYGANGAEYKIHSANIGFLNFYSSNQHSEQAKEKLKTLGNYVWDALIDSVDDNENFNRYAKIINDIDNIVRMLDK